jgi:hypothetical protein
VFIQEFFRFLLPMLHTCVSLLELCGDMADIVGVILELFMLVAENYTIFLDQVGVVWSVVYVGVSDAGVSDAAVFPSPG